MSDRHDEHLDDLLNRWAAGREPSEERMAKLREATLHEMASARFVALAETAPPPRTNWRMYGTLAALAAALLLAVVLPYVRRAGNDEKPVPLGRRQNIAQVRPGDTQNPETSSPDGVSSNSDDVPAAAHLDRDQLDRKAKLLRVLRETFPSDLLWVSETEGEIHIGLRSDAERSLANDERSAELAVRIVVAARRKNQRHWKTLCRADVMTEPQELVEVPLDGKDGGQLAVWACLLPDGMVAVDSDILLPGPRGLHASASAVQREGVPYRADSRAADGWEFRVFQTVGRLPAAIPAKRPVRRRS